MPQDKRERRFVDFVRSKLDQPLDERIFEFYTWKGIVVMRDADKFHKVAQALGQKELLVGRDGMPGYDLRVPGDFGNWTVALKEELRETFSEKYGSQYKISWL